MLIGMEVLEWAGSITPKSQKQPCVFISWVTDSICQQSVVIASHRSHTAKGLWWWKKRKGPSAEPEAKIEHSQLSLWVNYTLNMLRGPDRWTCIDTCSFYSVSCVIIVRNQFSISKWDCCIKVKPGVALWPALLISREYRKGQPYFSLMLLQNDCSDPHGSELAITSDFEFDLY